MMKNYLDILLVSMPFGSLIAPSLGLSILKNKLQIAGFKVAVQYLTFDFANIIGTESYIKIAEGAPEVAALVGEWIFSQGLFPNTNFDKDKYYDLISIIHKNRKGILKENNEDKLKAFIKEIERVRKITKDFQNRVADKILSYNSRIVGFTSVFQQHVSSLATAKLLKQKLPSLKTIIGGANCQDKMGIETFRSFDFIDAVVLGEGEDVIIPLVNYLLNDEEEHSSLGKGVLIRNAIQKTDQKIHCHIKPVENLDSIPFPDYTEFFEQFETLNARDSNLQARILFESSRGCWWGMKNQCTFCGLNGESLEYRSKSPNRTLSELHWLSQKHPGYPFFAVDNILDYKYFQSVLPALRDLEKPFEIFYETKSNLTRDKVNLLASAGVNRIQPGIESLCPSVLRIMRKGVDPFQNIQLLKWCAEFNVWPEWNFLWGFPNEPAKEYLRLSKMLPLIFHLPPPQNFCPIYLVRFSPNFINSKEFGFYNIKPYPTYEFVYHLSEEAIKNIAFYFTFTCGTDNSLESSLEKVAYQINKWRAVHSKCKLLLTESDEMIIIRDTRTITASENKWIVLRGIERLVYQICDHASSLNKIYKALYKHHSYCVSKENILIAINSLINKNLLICIDGLYLSIATRSHGPEKMYYKKLPSFSVKD